MKIKTDVYRTHEFTAEEFVAMEKTYDMIKCMTEVYGSKCVLSSPNDGEIVGIDELPRVLGILSFLMENRVVEVDAKIEIDWNDFS